MCCDYKDCNLPTASFALGTIDDGTSLFTLCAVHQIMYAIDAHRENIHIHEESKLGKSVGTCDLCSAPALQFIDGGETEYHLCEPHLRKLFMRHLDPHEFKVLYKKHGDVYLLHDGFYDPDSGECFQPVR